MDDLSYSERKKYLYSEIVEKIERMIEAGELKVGDRLPAERHLAQTFKVSRNSIRQAIQALTQKGLLESRRGDGTYLCAPDPSAMVNSFALAIQAEKELLKEIIEFRMLIEPQIAGLAARNITPEELDRLKIIVFEQERENLAGRHDGELDATFHLLLAKSSKNRIVQRVADTLNSILNESRSEYLQSESRRKASIIGHFKIIEALEAKDGDRASEAMREHLLAIEREIFGSDGGA